jgi:hypothetical protein
LPVTNDPIQPNEVASENATQKLRDWYSGVILQRLLPGGAIVLVMHRLRNEAGKFSRDGGSRAPHDCISQITRPKEEKSGSGEWGRPLRRDEPAFDCLRG